MKLNFVLTLEDYVAFSVDQSRNIPAYRKQGALYRLIGFLLFAAFGAWKAVKTPGGSFFSLILFFVLGFGWIFLYSHYARWNIRRQYKSYFNNPSHTQCLGKRHMQIINREMILETEGGKETIDLSGITRLTSDKNRYFLYFGDDAGMPVPYTAFASKEEARTFLQLIRTGAKNLWSEDAAD